MLISVYTAHYSPLIQNGFYIIIIIIAILLQTIQDKFLIHFISQIYYVCINEVQPADPPLLKHTNILYVHCIEIDTFIMSKITRFMQLSQPSFKFWKHHLSKEEYTYSQPDSYVMQHTNLILGLSQATNGTRLIFCLISIADKPIKKLLCFITLKPCSP